MRFRTRHLLALTLVASALCADRAAAEVQRADLTAVRVGGLVDRLTVGLRRTVPTPALVRQRCSGNTVVVVPPPPVAVPTVAATVPPICPAQLPLPPPRV